MKLIVIYSIVLLLFSCHQHPAVVKDVPPSIPVLMLTTASGTTNQEYPASIEGIVNIEIRPQVGGVLNEVFVDEGTLVKKGQPLFSIDEQPFRAALNNAKAGLAAAEGMLQNANLEIEKLTPLVQNKVVADYQLKTAKATAAIATANIDNAKATIATATINLGYTIIKAPVSGFIGRIPRKHGSLVGPADPVALTDLSDVHDVRVYFSLGEYDFIQFKDHYPGETLGAKIKQLPPVELILADDSEYKSKGKIDMIDGQFNKNTGAITVRATFPNAGGLLRSGNTGKIRLQSKFSDAVQVPQSATLEIQDKVFVFLVGADNKVSRHQLTISGITGNSYLIKDGLKAGERIVYAGFDHLNEGQIITPEKMTAPLAQN